MKSRSALEIVGALAALAAVVAAILVGSYYGGILGNRVQASYQKRTVTSKVQQSVRTAAFAQSAYEQFFTDCNAVVAANEKIAQATERVKELRSLPADQFGQTGAKIADAVTDLTGLQQLRAETAARYNASAAEYTRGQFLDASLPAEIRPPYTEVTCP